MRWRTRLLGISLCSLLAGLGIGCSKISVPLIFSPTPTLPPTQVSIPTLIVVAVPSPTLNLVPPGDNAEAAVMLKDFVEAVSRGNVDGALTYWNTKQPGQPSGYAANVRKMVQEWADKKRQLVLGEITYFGRDTTGKSVAMPVTDPRVEQAIAKVQIDGVEYQFYLTQLKGGWYIEGVNTFSK
jgi:hypothetical protein